jgi:hypothetical protein
VHMEQIQLGPYVIDLLKGVFTASQHCDSSHVPVNYSC